MNGKRSRLLLPVAALLVASGFPLPARAQQSSPDAGFVAPKPAKPKVDTTPVEKPSAYDISGVVQQAFKMKKPLELINPLAPASYGDGSEDISWDPDNPEKPKGIIVLGIQW